MAADTTNTPNYTPPMNVGDLMKMLSQPVPQAYNQGAPDPNLPAGPGGTPQFAPGSLLGAQQAASNTAASGPNSADVAAVQGAAQQQGAAAQQAVLNQTKPDEKDYQWENYQAPPMPERQTVPIPQRGAPRTDPMSAILAAIAGFISPQAAGEFGAAPLQAGNAVADQQYKDALQGYEARNAVVGQTFADQMAARDSQVKTDLYNREGTQTAEKDYAEDLQKWGNAAAPVAGAAAEGKTTQEGMQGLSSRYTAAAQASGMLSVLNDYCRARETKSAADMKRFEDSREKAIDMLGKQMDSARKAGDDAAQRQLEHERIVLQRLTLAHTINADTDKSNLDWAGFIEKEKRDLPPSIFNDPRLQPLRGERDKAFAFLRQQQSLVNLDYLKISQANPAWAKRNPQTIWESLQPNMVSANADLKAAQDRLDTATENLWHTKPGMQRPSGVSGLALPQGDGAYSPNNTQTGALRLIN